MVISRKHFAFNNTCVIEKLHIRPPFRHGAVFHNEACFLYVKEGRGLLKSPVENFNIQISESVLLKCGNYFADFLRESGTEHCEVFVIHLHSNLLKELYKEEIPGFIKRGDKKHFAQKIQEKSIVNHFIESLDFYFENPALVNDELLSLKIKELILLLIQTSNSESIIHLFAHLFTPRQANFKEVIQTHLFSNLTISELAILSGRSLSAFKRDFEAYFKATPANYIREQKLLKAKELLGSTDRSISEICYEAGFSDTSHFTKLFRKKYHLSPSEYRQQR